MCHEPLLFCVRKITFSCSVPTYLPTTSLSRPIVYLPTYPNMYLPTYLYILPHHHLQQCYYILKCLPMQLSTYLPIYLLTNHHLQQCQLLPTYLPLQLSTCLPIQLAINLPTYLPIYLPTTHNLDQLVFCSCACSHLSFYFPNLSPSLQVCSFPLLVSCVYYTESSSRS